MLKLNLGKKIKKIHLAIVIFLILIFLLFSYNYRLEILFNTLTSLGYNETSAKRLSFIISEKPFESSFQKLNNLFNRWKNIGVKEELNIAINLKKNFANYNSPKIDFGNGNHYLNIYESLKKKHSYQNQRLEYSEIWKNKMPVKVWSISTSNEILSEKKSSQKNFLLKIQSTPKICGNKLVYARPDGIIGAINYKTGRKIWNKQYGKIPALSTRGFFCEYEKNLNKHIIILPTGQGVYCLDSFNGSLISSRCGGGRMGVFESRVSPQLVGNVVYVATVKPSGMEAYNFLTGKLIWRQDFEIGKFFYGVGANPWSNFTIDREKKFIFVNTGSPGDRFKLGNLKKYKYNGSLLAINLKNGAIVWQFQEHERDTWNHDFVGKPILSPIKIDGKDIVITFSKSGSIYFIDRNNGLPVFPVGKETIKIGDFKYDYKKSILPESLLDNDYYNYIGNDCKNCDLNTKLFGPFPPILKFKRIFDGYNGGPQWPGGSIDILNNFLILPSNHNFIVETFYDYFVTPPFSLPQNKLVQKCTSCHNKEGGVDTKDKTIIPSLFLTTKIYDSLSLKNYLKKNNFHKKLNFNDKDLLEAYEALKKYDKKIIDKNQYKYFQFRDNVDLDKKRDINSKRLSLGKISAISLKSGKMVWQIPAGTYKLNNSEVIIGSQSAGGITDAKNNEGISFFTGSLDKKIYAFRNKDGKYLWSDKLPASGSAPPLVHNTSTERWIFVVAGGRAVPEDWSENIVAFKQKLN